MHSSHVILIIIAISLIIWYLSHKQIVKEGYTPIPDRMFIPNRIRISQKYGLQYVQSNFTLVTPGPGNSVQFNGISHRYTNRSVNSTHGPINLRRPNGMYLKSNVNPPVDHYDIPLPSTFTTWADKGYLLKVLDQFGCGDCWAFAICEMMAQRLMIATNGKITIPMSTQYLASCYNKSPGAMGCQGGVPELVLNTIKQYGIIQDSVFSYKERTETTLPCAGYPKMGCLYHVSTVTPLCIQTPNGQPNADSFGYSTRLDQNTINHNVQQMKTEIMLNGPIIAGIICYNDLYSFVPTKDNVYVPNPGSGAVGGHAIVIVGWGTNYWICQNSWGENWGYGLDYLNSNNSQGGYWNMIMGQNACEIESFCVSAAPALNDPCAS